MEKGTKSELSTVTKGPNTKKTSGDKSGGFAGQNSIHEGHVSETRDPIKIDDNSMEHADFENNLHALSGDLSGLIGRPSGATPSGRG